MERQEAGRKGGEASLHSEKVSAAQIQTYLKGIDYPVDKQHLVDYAKSHGATENVVSTLSKLPERQYTKPTEVEKEFGKEK